MATRIIEIYIYTIRLVIQNFPSPAPHDAQRPSYDQKLHDPFEECPIIGRLAILRLNGC